MKISIMGTGYVGLVTGVGLASVGHQVICVDIDKQKVGKINKGISPIYEEGLEKLLSLAIKKNLLSATADLKSAILNTQATFIALPTPSKKNNDIDLSFIKKASKDIGKILKEKENYHLIVVKSTVAPETSLKIVLPLIKKYSGKKNGEFGLCMNPEFLREGDAVVDFMNPDRIVIGQLDEKSGDQLLEIYQPFKTDFLRTSLSNAEMIKYTNNALLSTLISFSNEIASIAEQIPGADAFEILKGVYLDKRINPIINGQRVNPNILTYIYPGCGFGGSCFPKDVKALASFAQKKGLNPSLLSAVLDINKKQPLRIIKIAEKKLGNLAGKKIAILGLAFKPGTDDTRESPAFAIIKELKNKKANFLIHDPIVNSKNLKTPEGLKNIKIEFAESVNHAIKNSDACFLVTNWQEYKNITPDLLKKEMKNPLMVDGRGLLNNKNDFDKNNNYLGIGLGKKKLSA